MNWKDLTVKYHKIISNDDNESQNDNNESKNDDNESQNDLQNESQNESQDKLQDYIKITRNNLIDLEIGMHIKYIKKEIDPITKKEIDKIYSGGFLTKILNPDKIVLMELVLKSNIIWKLRFIKYDCYGKKPENFKINKSINKLHSAFESEINKRKEELNIQQNEKIKNIIKNKSKYIINF